MSTGRKDHQVKSDAHTNFACMRGQNPKCYHCFCFNNPDSLLTFVHRNSVWFVDKDIALQELKCMPNISAHESREWEARLWAVENSICHGRRRNFPSTEEDKMNKMILDELQVFHEFMGFLYIQDYECRAWEQHPSFLTFTKILVMAQGEMQCESLETDMWEKIYECAQRIHDLLGMICPTSSTPAAPQPTTEQGSSKDDLTKEVLAHLESFIDAINLVADYYHFGLYDVCDESDIDIGDNNDDLTMLLREVADDFLKQFNYNPYAVDGWAGAGYFQTYWGIADVCGILKGLKKWCSGQVITYYPMIGGKSKYEKPFVVVLKEEESVDDSKPETSEPRSSVTPEEEKTKPNRTKSPQ